MPTRRISQVKLIATLQTTFWCAHPTNTNFDQAFVKFLDGGKYWGGAVAAMKGGKLLIAKGYGTDQDGKEVTHTSKFPVSSIAKSLTGVAVMQLIQAGKISLQDKVFGESGILKALKAWRDTVDPRLYDITVDHLLHHSAGWDVTKPPLYDPLFNQQYQKQHGNVPNMVEDLGLSPPLQASDIIRYVMSYSLSFTPGTRTAYSNVAYLVLGRVIEAVSDTEYNDFVKRFVLEPCGMWNTRLTTQNNTKVTAEEAGDAGYNSLDPFSADSALGWYSNVYDLMRFMRCTFETEKILSNKYKKMLLDKPSSSLLEDNDSWYSAGFHTNSNGNVWQDADKHTDDLILYYNMKLHDSEVLDLPDSWVILLHGNNHKKLKHDAKNLMSLLDLANPTENLFLYDLSDLYQHSNGESLTKENTPSYTIKYQVDEHRLVAYTSALQDEDFNIIWLTSYTVNHHTFFLLIGKYIEQPTRSQYDYIVEHGMDHRQLLKRKLQLEESGYNMTELHSYRSQAHNNPISFAAIFRQEAFSPDMQMKYGTGHLPEPYEKLVQMYYEKQFHPMSQTVVHHEDEEQFSFIFIRGTEVEPIDFKHYYDLSAHRLAKLTAENAKANLHLAYLNSYDVSGKFRMAAVFTNATASAGKLDIDQTEHQATKSLISNLKKGMFLKYMVPYIGEDSQMKLATFYGDEQSP
ncbi:unnamed protein product [Candidula unifasciata]|uniref:Beta-lactamase-related domain-containing protein n=1 Tax=Candidula unifasciata TaxID=100452 RepID=A0A8S3ZD73_9EUPU|nr:unnamed protein product [Candidula unifasciata]